MEPIKPVAAPKTRRCRECKRNRPAELVESGLCVDCQ